MNIYLNEITGMADGIVALHMSKRTWNKELDDKIRTSWDAYQKAEDKSSEEHAFIRNRIASFCKYAWKHIALLDMVTVSVTVDRLHRAGQDDWDAHACRYNNRIIRASTRLADFGEGEMSDFYDGKIIPTDLALKTLGFSLPQDLIVGGKRYVKGVNGYILEEFKDDRDVKRGLYMESIPSTFIFKVNMAQWAHVYKMRRAESSANPEVKQCAEAIQTLIEGEMPWFNKEFIMKVLI